MAYVLTVLLAISINCGSISNAGVPSTETGPAGTWTGESICMVKDSPCHDEKVIYHITEPDASGKLQIQADKVVNGKAEGMGTLDCSFDKKSSAITCSMKNGLWEFSVNGNKIEGTLKHPDGSIFRRVNLTKGT